MVDILQVMEGATYAAFIVGAMVAVVELRGMSKERRSNFVLDMIRFMTSPEVGQQYERIMRAEFKDGKQAEEKVGHSGLNGQANTWDALGLMVRRGFVEADLVLELSDCSQLFEHMRPWILQEREKYGPEVFEHFEYLAGLDRESRAKKRTEVG